MKKRMLSVVLGIVMLFSLIAGCAAGNKSQNESATGTSGGQASSGANSGGSGNAASGDSSKPEPEQKEPLQIKMFLGLYNELPDMNNAFWTEWQKRANVKLDIEWVPSGDLETKTELLLSSGDLPEVMMTQNNATRPALIRAIKSGAFWDLTPFLGDFSNYPNLRDNTPPNWQKYLSVDGKIYAVPRSRSRIDIGIKIRKDWLDQLGLPVPTTLDEYRNALKMIVESDLDGNGAKDTLGLIGHDFLVADGDNAFGAAFGLLDPHFDENGGFIPKQLNPKYADMVEWFRGLYADGILPKEFSVIKKTQAEELYKTGRAASYARSIWWDKEFEDSISKTQPGAKIVNLALQGPGGWSVDLAAGTNGGFYISKKVPEEKVKQILDYFEFTASDEMTDLAYYGLEGIHHTVVDGQKVLTEQGVKEINTTAKGAGVLAYAKWGKVDSASGTKEYNEAKRKEVEHFDQVGKVDPMVGLLSDTWNNEWPKYQQEWQTMVTRAIVGQISVDEFRSYIDRLRNLPEMQKAFQELAESYKSLNS